MPTVFLSEEGRRIHSREFALRQSRASCTKWDFEVQDPVAIKRTPRKMKTCLFGSAVLLLVAQLSTSFISPAVISRSPYVQQLSTVLSMSTQQESKKESTPDLTKLQSYFQLVVDSNGETSMVKREFQDVEEKGYAASPQLVQQLDPEFATPTNVVFTQLAGENPWHHCPAPQLVTCTHGGWYIRTTDNKVTEFRVGDILFQDNTQKHPAAQDGTKKAQHFSGSLDNQPCDQIIVQLDLKKGLIPNSKNAPAPL